MGRNVERMKDIALMGIVQHWTVSASTFGTLQVIT